MRRLSDEELNDVFDRSSGRCHLCHKQLVWKNHGAAGKRGAWHVDHSRPRARGGTDYLRNLLPACVTCNCSKGAGTNRVVRARHGRTRAPLSRELRSQEQFGNAVGFAAVGWVLARAFLGPSAAILAALVGAAIGARANPDEL